MSRAAAPVREGAGAGRGARGRGNTPGQRLALIVFLLGPLAVLAVLSLLIAQSLKTGPRMHAAPVGAGAGQTGMSNEYTRPSPGEAEGPGAPAPPE